MSKRQVAAVIRRLTIEPVTAADAAIVVHLRPGKRATWCHRTARAFLRKLHEQAPSHLTRRQRRFLWRLAYQYRLRLPGALAAEACSMRAWAYANIQVDAVRERLREAARPDEVIVKIGRIIDHA